MNLRSPLATRLATAICALGLLASERSQAAAPSVDPQALLKKVDDAQTRGGSFKMTFFMVNQQGDAPAIAREGSVFGMLDSTDDRLVILFSKPKTEQGTGYLRIEENLWSYDASVGRWERRTERDRIAGTDSRREDFEAPELAKKYVATYEGESQLGTFKTYTLLLKVKPGVDVAFPMKRIWVAQDSCNLLKELDYSLSGKLVRSAVYPKWQKAYSEAKKGDVSYASEMRFDDAETHGKTFVTVRSMALQKVEMNVFTKAWFEGQSR